MHSTPNESATAQLAHNQAAAMHQPKTELQYMEPVCNQSAAMQPTRNEDGCHRVQQAVQEQRQRLHGR